MVNQKRKKCKRRKTNEKVSWSGATTIAIRYRKISCTLQKGHRYIVSITLTILSGTVDRYFSSIFGSSIERKE